MQKFGRVDSMLGVSSKLVSTNHWLQSSWLESMIGWNQLGVDTWHRLHSPKLLHKVWANIRKDLLSVELILGGRRGKLRRQRLVRRTKGRHIAWIPELKSALRSRLSRSVSVSLVPPRFPSLSKPHCSFSSSPQFSFRSSLDVGQSHCPSQESRT